MTVVNSIKEDLAKVAEEARDLGSKLSGSAFGEGAISASNAATLTALVILILIALVLLRVLLRRKPVQSPDTPLSGQTRSARWMGYAVAVLFFGVLGVWAWYAPLSSAALAPGVVSPGWLAASSRATISLAVTGGFPRDWDA